MATAVVARNAPYQLLFDVSSAYNEQIEPFRRAAEEIAKDLAATVTWRANVACERAESAIDAALRLGTGWDSYHAAPPSKEAADLARCIIEIVRNDYFAVPHIMASAEGGIATAFSLEDRFAQVEILNSGAVLTTVFSRTAPPRVEEFSTDKQSLSSAIETVRDFLFG